MTLVTNGSVVLLQGTSKELFIATSEIPSIIGGHIDANALSNSDDIVEVQLEVKYSSGGSFFDAGKISFKKSDEICWFTPIEASFGYKLTLLLTNEGTSSNATLDFVIQATPVV